MKNLSSKYSIYLLVLISMIINPLHACDVCGCSVSNNFMGLLPQYRISMVGIKTQYARYKYEYNDLISNKPPKYNLFTSTEIQYRHKASNRILLSAQIPYSYKTQIDNENSITKGLGDMRTSFYYFVLNTSDSIKKIVRNSIIMGATVQLPTGKYMQRMPNKTLYPLSMQNGTGAYSFPIMAQHTLFYKKWGLNTELNYTYNSENELTYQIGSSWSASQRIYFLKQFLKSSLIFQSGYAFKNKQLDHEYGQALKTSGGNWLYWDNSIDYINKLGNISFKFRKPITTPNFKDVYMDKYFVWLDLNIFIRS